MKEDITSLALTKWRCQYYIVFAPKYRRKMICGKYKAEIGKILRRICERRSYPYVGEYTAQDTSWRSLRSAEE